MAVIAISSPLTAAGGGAKTGFSTWAGQIAGRRVRRQRKKSPKLRSVLTPGLKKRLPS
jgi:hypothetical protein